MQKTILIAEDSLDEIFVMRKAFAEAAVRHQLRFVPNGVEAIDYLRRKPFYNRQLFPVPAAIVLEVGMPAKNGFEVLQWIRTESDHKELPVILLTDRFSPEDQARANELGASGFYVKDPTALVGIFKEIDAKWLV